MAIEQTWSLEKVLAETDRVTLYAEPISERVESPWLALEKGTAKRIKKAIGRADYKAHEGLGLTPRGIFIVIILSENEKYVTVRNASTWPGAKMKIEKEIVKKVKKEVVYPIFFGRDIDRWKLSGKKAYSAIILYTPSTGKILSESFAKINFSNAYAYYSDFKETLVKAANYKQYGKGKPCYFIHRMGKKVFSPIKVVWGEVGTQVNAAVVSGTTSLSNSFLIPDYTCVYIPLANEDEAYYVCAILNSTISFLVTSYIHLHPDPHILEHIKIERYDEENKIHRKLSKLSKTAHQVAQENDENELLEIENKIDVLVAKLYGLSNKELESLKKQS